ncbi:MAG: AI-2E family transporter [Prochloraceae cyanobacterium]|nr:AI-2E family transporter [Prochloraceae cyanobacterium]
MNQTFSPLQKFLITWLLILVTGWFTVKTFSYFGELISILLTAALIAFLLNYAVIALKIIIPRTLAAILVYLFAAVFVSFMVLTFLPVVFNQAGQLIERLPEILAEGEEKLNYFQTWSVEHHLPFNVQILTSQTLAKIQGQAEAITSKGFDIVLGTFNGLLDIILIVVLSFYMLLDGEKLWRSVTCFFVPKIQNGLTKTLRKNLQLFVAGQILLGLFMATSLTITFRLLGVPFFLVFAVFIGFMEIIPFVGATLGIGTVVIVVSFIDLWLALQILVLSVGIQQIKDNLIAPRILGNLTGLSPVIIFVCLILGARIGGLLGVILAIPLTGVVKSLIEIVGDPSLPPQTGAFFQNPLKKSDRINALSPANNTIESDRP